MKRWKHYSGRLIFTALGLLIAISFLTLGFFKTAVILLCCVVGYALGAAKDLDIRIPENLKFWRRKW